MVYNNVDIYVLLTSNILVVYNNVDIYVLLKQTLCVGCGCGGGAGGGGGQHKISLLRGFVINGLRIYIYCDTLNLQ